LVGSVPVIKLHDYIRFPNDKILVYQVCNPCDLVSNLSWSIRFELKPVWMVNRDVLASSYFPNSLFEDGCGRIYNSSPNPGGMLFGFVYMKVFIEAIFCFEGFS
jgi:hypothetical protein